MMTPFGMLGTFPLPDVFLFGTGIVLFARGFRSWNERRLILNTPRAQMRSLAMGLVELEGTATPRSTLRAPFSNNDCAYWAVDISVRSKDSWSVVHRNASGHPFYLRDSTASVMVYPAGAEAKLVPGVEEICNGPIIPSPYAEYCKDQHVAGVGRFTLGQVRFRERLVAPGQQLFVMGTAMPRAQAMTISEPEELAATGTDGAPGRSHAVDSLQEMDRATVAVVRRGENQKTFILSQQSERTLTTELEIQAMAQLVGGPLLSLIGLGWWLFLMSQGHRIH